MYVLHKIVNPDFTVKAYLKVIIRLKLFYRPCYYRSVCSFSKYLIVFIVFYESMKNDRDVFFENWSTYHLPVISIDR